MLYCPQPPRQPEPRRRFWKYLILINSSVSLNHLPKANAFLLEQRQRLMPQHPPLGYVSEAECSQASANMDLVRLHSYPSDFSSSLHLQKSLLQVPVTLGQPGVRGPTLEGQTKDALGAVGALPWGWGAEKDSAAPRQQPFHRNLHSRWLC